MRVGFSKQDITPRTEVSLSGFIFRMNRPAEGVDAPLHVRALALESARRETLLIMSFDLIGLGPELTERITARALRANAGGTSPDRVCLVCTHNHSAPATVHLENCGLPSADYWDQLVEAGARAAAEAMASLTGPVSLSWEAIALPQASYNRRRVLEDGRVTMALHPDTEVLREGPLDDTLFLGRFESADGGKVAGICHFAAHADTVCSLQITPDYPGLLCAELEDLYAMPFLFLQGASANINPVFEEMTSRQMRANVAAMMTHVRESSPARSGVEAGPVSAAAGVVDLPYAPLPSPAELEDRISALEHVARGDVESAAGSRALVQLGNLLNIRPGEPIDMTRARFAAETMAMAHRRALERATGGALPESCWLNICALRIGDVLFPILAAEVFSETGFSLQQQFPGRVLRTVGYGSPLCGYLPTEEALLEGGYEVEDAHLFYGHPAPFAGEAEAAAREAAAALLNECLEAV